MNILSVENLEKTVNDEPLFTNLTFGLEKGEKVGIVGKNGCGKSTLLKLLYGILPPDEGNISIKNGLVISYLSQNIEFEDDTTVKDYFHLASSPLLDIIHQYDKALEDGDTKLYTALYERIETEDLWGMERKYFAYIEDFETGCKEDDLVKYLSGGQQKKIAIARTLALRGDLILLDEPTNHLDIKTIEKLEEILKTPELSAIIVTHDRHILNTACSTIFELDRASFYRHPGNFSSYLERRAERIAFAQKEQDRLKTILRRELEWLKRGPQARTGKDKNRKDRIYDMLDSQHNVQDIKQRDFQSVTRRLGKKILEIENISKSFDDQLLFEDFSFSFVKGMKIGLVGDNGTGKSTLLDIFTGRTEPDTGSVDIGVNTHYGYYDQKGRDLKLEKTVLEYITDIGEKIDLGNGEIVSAARFLEIFGFPARMHPTPIYTLSGGERRRLYLISRLVQNPNFLLLDEPTNDLDIATMENLEEYIASFAGCAVICSHDRTFLDITTDMLFILEDGKITLYPGHYSEWKEERDEKAKEEERLQKEREKAVVQEAPKRENTKKKGLSYKETREKEALEKEIEDLETEKAEIEASFSTIPANDYETLQKNTDRYNEIEKRLEEASDRWLELEEKAEN